LKTALLAPAINGVVVFKNILTKKESFMKNIFYHARNTVKYGIPIAAVAISSFLSSCDKDAPSPTEKIENVTHRIEANVSSIKNMADRINKDIGNSNKYIKNLEIAGNLGLGANDFDVLDQVRLWKEALGERFAMGAVYPMAYGIMLTSGQVKIIKNFDIIPNPETKDAFWIHGSDKMELNATQLASVQIFDREILLDHAGALSDKITQALKLAEQEPISLIIAPGVELDAEQTPEFFRLRGKKVVVVGQDSTPLRVTVTEHPTSTEKITALYDINMPIYLVIGKNGTAPGGLNAIGLNDSIADILRTRATLEKTSGHVTTVSENGDAINPVLGTLTGEVNWDKDVSVDGVAAMPISLKTAHFGTADGNAGFFMVMASHYVATDGGKSRLAHHFAEGGVNVTFDQADKYKEEFNIAKRGMTEYLNVDYKSFVWPDITLAFGLQMKDGKLVIRGQNIAFIVEDNGFGDYDLHKDIKNVEDYFYAAKNVLVQKGVSFDQSTVISRWTSFSTKDRLGFNLDGR
jgi:hypothetical protein